MTDPGARNRLDEEESPYLRAHADNPVDWQPWDERALELARDRDQPIFLSIGYSACHWCHVMADESFEDEAIADLLNEQFVPIKVDREERPDVDRIYQTICQQVSGRGGWPLSVWLTPEGKPFQVGTYFPNEAKRGMPGFGDVLEGIGAAWNDDDERENIYSRAEQWTSALTGELEAVPDQPLAPEEDLLLDGAKAAVRGADRHAGGWGGGPKFPHAGRLHLLMRAYDETNVDDYLDVLREALDAMANGGMYDQIGGGFHRYATDRDWTIPHFEKMLYDNAELPRAYLAAFQLTEEERYATVARETLEFLKRELQHEDGGFFAALDAQSEDESGNRKEGAYYVWTPEEVRDVIDDEEAADLTCRYFGITDTGNFSGTSVLTRQATIEDLAEEFELDESDVQAGIERATEELRIVREERPRPPRDEKILAGWNGLAISAFAEAAIVLDESFAEPAVEALEFVRTHLWEPPAFDTQAGDDSSAGRPGERDSAESVSADDVGRLKRRYAEGVAKIDGYLEDYAFLARGAFNCYEATRDVDHLDFALELARAISVHFWDEAAETLYVTPADGEELIARPQDLTDQSTPSSMAVTAELFAMLDHFTAEEAFGTIAESVVDTHGQKLRSNPLQLTSMVLAADTVTNGPLEVTLATAEPPEDWIDELRERYLGARVLAWRPPDEALDEWLETLGFSDPPPIWEDRNQRRDRATVFVCRSRTCSPPRNNIVRSLNWAKRML